MDKLGLFEFDDVRNPISNRMDLDEITKIRDNAEKLRDSKGRKCFSIDIRSGILIKAQELGERLASCDHVILSGHGGKAENGERTMLVQDGSVNITEIERAVSDFPVTFSPAGCFIYPEPEARSPISESVDRAASDKRKSVENAIEEILSQSTNDGNPCSECPSIKRIYVLYGRAAEVGRGSRSDVTSDVITGAADMLSY